MSHAPVNGSVGNAIGIRPDIMLNGVYLVPAFSDEGFCFSTLPGKSPKPPLCNIHGTNPQSPFMQTITHGTIPVTTATSVIFPPLNPSCRHFHTLLAPLLNIPVITRVTTPKTQTPAIQKKRT